MRSETSKSNDPGIFEFVDVVGGGGLLEDAELSTGPSGAGSLVLQQHSFFASVGGFTVVVDGGGAAVVPGPRSETVRCFADILPMASTLDRVYDTSVVASERRALVQLEARGKGGW